MLTVCLISDTVGVMPASDIATEVGATIRSEMGRQRVNWSELSRRTGVSRSSLAHQVNESRVTVDTLVLIAQALKVTPATFLPDLADDASVLPEQGRATA